MKVKYGQWEPSPDRVRHITSVRRGLFGIPVRFDVFSERIMRRRRHEFWVENGQQMASWEWEYETEGDYVVG